MHEGRGRAGRVKRDPVAELNSSPGWEGARRATGNPGERGPDGASDPEAIERGKRRRFTADWKHRILREADPSKGTRERSAQTTCDGRLNPTLL